MGLGKQAKKLNGVYKSQPTQRGYSSDTANQIKNTILNNRELNKAEHVKETRSILAPFLNTGI